MTPIALGFHRAVRLRRTLQGESTSYLRRSLSLYQEAGAVPAAPGTAIWSRPATREAKTLELVLKPAARKRGR